MLEQLATAQQMLNGIDDQLSVAITAIEGALRDRVSVRISVEVPNESFTRVSYGKHGGRWSLFIQIGDHETQLSSCSREMRAQAFAGGHVERLLRESITSIEAQAASRKAATDAANRVLNLLKGT